MEAENVGAFLTLEDWEQSLIVSSLQRVVAMMEAGDVEATPILTADAMEPSPDQAAGER